MAVTGLRFGSEEGRGSTILNFWRWEKSLQAFKVMELGKPRIVQRLVSLRGLCTCKHAVCVDCVRWHRYPYVAENHSFRYNNFMQRTITSISHP